MDMGKTQISVGKDSGAGKTRMDALYEKIGKFLQEHPEAMELNAEESDKLFEAWMRDGK